jgi:hypothetical protein
MRTHRVIGSVAVTLLLAGGLAACEIAKQGEGPVTSETRQTEAFTQIDVTGGIGITLRIGSPQPIEVRAQANLLPIIATEVEGGTLRIHAKENFRATERIQVVIQVPSLEAAKMGGGSTGQVDGLAGESFALDLSGGSVMTATGTASSIALVESGGSRASLHDLAAKTVVLNISGGSIATIQASGSVTGSAAGGSRATVRGAATMSVQATGGSTVSHE